jgi:hypothetical protein
VAQLLLEHEVEARAVDGDLPPQLAPPSSIRATSWPMRFTDVSPPATMESATVAKTSSSSSPRPPSSSCERRRSLMRSPSAHAAALRSAISSFTNASKSACR